MEIVRCIICNSVNNNFYDQISCEYGQQYHLVQCECDFVFLNPKPELKDLSNYYISSSYTPHSKKTYIYRIIRYITFFWKFNKISKIFQSYKGLHLDIGSGDGFFSNMMIKKGWNSYSFDTFYSNDKNYKDILDIDNSSIDLITLWHSLEHLHDIHELLSIITKKIKKNGYIIIACPNINSIDSKIFKSQWIAYDVPRHLYHFSPNSINRLLKKYNININSNYSIPQDTFFNIFFSIKTNKFFRLILFPYYVAIYFILSLFNNNKSSSYLYICKFSG